MVSVKRTLQIISFVGLSTLILVAYQNATVNSSEYTSACLAKSACKNILKSMHEARLVDEGNSVPALTAGEILKVASNRFGYGLSSVDQTFLPDKVDDRDLAKIAWILYSQISGDDPTLEDVSAQQRGRLTKVNQELSAHIVNSRSFDCIKEDPAFKVGSGHNFIEIPTAQLSEAMLRARAKYSKIPRADRSFCEKSVGTRLRRLLSEITAKKQLVDTVLRTQYTSEDGSIKDLQMDYEKVLNEFWYNHFNVDAFKPSAIAYGSQSLEHTIDRKQKTSFRELLGAVIKHPAMLMYLDNDANFYVNNEPSNQNLGRELLELHTFGVGPKTATDNSPYNQVDIEVASTIFTGHTVLGTIDPKTNKVVSGYAFVGGKSFNTSNTNNYHTKFWISRAANNRPLFFSEARLRQLNSISMEKRLDYMLDELAGHPVTRSNICRKLTRRFVATYRSTYSTLRSACVDAFQKTVRGHETQLKNIYFAIAQQPSMWVRETASGHIANPLELVLKSVRATGIRWSSLHPAEGSRIPALAAFLDIAVKKMGLTYKKFGDPTGYPMSGSSWLSKGYLINHVHLSMAYAQLDRILKVVTTERKMTDSKAIEKQVKALHAKSPVVDVRKATFGPVRGVASVHPISTFQSNTIKATVGSSALHDGIREGRDVNSSLMDTILSLSKTTITEMRK